MPGKIKRKRKVANDTCKSSNTYNKEDISNDNNSCGSSLTQNSQGKYVPCFSSNTTNKKLKLDIPKTISVPVDNGSTRKEEKENENIETSDKITATTNCNPKSNEINEIIDVNIIDENNHIPRINIDESSVTTLHHSSSSNNDHTCTVDGNDGSQEVVEQNKKNITLNDDDNSLDNNSEMKEKEESDKEDKIKRETTDQQEIEIINNDIEKVMAEIEVELSDFDNEEVKNDPQNILATCEAPQEIACTVTCTTSDDITSLSPSSIEYTIIHDGHQSTPRQENSSPHSELVTGHLLQVPDTIVHVPDSITDVQSSQRLPEPFPYTQHVLGEVAVEQLDDSLTGLQEICFSQEDIPLPALLENEISSDIVIMNDVERRRVETGQVPSLSPSITSPAHLPPKCNTCTCNNTLSDSSTMLQGLVHEMNQLNQYIQACRRELDIARKQRAIWLKTQHNLKRK